MSTAPPTFEAHWLCHELKVPTYTPLRPGDRRTWSRADFDHTLISRDGVSLHMIDGAWSLVNNSAVMQAVYLLDTRYGRRRMPAPGSLRLQRLRSWLLLPGPRGHDRPHVVTIALVQPNVPAAESATGARDTAVAATDDRMTENAGEPTGDDLEKGLGAARAILARREQADLAGVYARPYFTISTSSPEPPGHKQVSVCLPGDTTRGERLLNRLRAAVYGKAEGQPADELLRLLIRHGVLTFAQVRAVHHAPGCGHLPEQIDPTAYLRRATDDQ